MGAELCLIAVVLLVCFAIGDLMVGVSNDAVNFLNSSIGSRVAPRRVIMIIASLGILAGVVFSSGMMEVARKGIFHPQLFTMPELMTVFLAVMIADIILLDLFNTFGLPTSTTVSIVFELLGAAVVLSILKIAQTETGPQELSEYINTAKAMAIISGILLSVVVAFVFGALIQALTRILFTFEYEQTLKRYGSLWGGVAMASITYFILVKGAKGAAFLTPEAVDWIKSNTILILGVIFALSAVLLQLLMKMGVHILKPIVLVGTFALALAFAANDLVNFIGVPLAGYHSYEAAMATDDPLNVTMAALTGKVKTETLFLLFAGLIMVGTLWFSRKARTVTETEISLGQQEESQERFGTSFIGRATVKMAMSFGDAMKAMVPSGLQARIARRMDPSRYLADTHEDDRPSFDLLRASVNLMVASAVVSFATSKKLPLSTTYVTFMVAMGTSFADQAWGRETAVYRVTGVLTVIGGWFMTALMAFTLAGIYAAVIFYLGGAGIGLLLLLTGFVIWKNHHRHKEKVKEKEEKQIFNLSHITDSTLAISTTFAHASILIKEIRESLARILPALFEQKEDLLKKEKKKSNVIQTWVNIIIANVFKAMRLLHKSDEEISHKYAQSIRRLQKLADGHRDIAMRAYDHVSNYHKGLLDVQVSELTKVGEHLDGVLLEVESTLDQKQTADYQSVVMKDRALRQLAESLNQDQTLRIQDESSKTRLSILFYAIVGNAMMLSKQTLMLLQIFEESFGGKNEVREYDLD